MNNANSGRKQHGIDADRSVNYSLTLMTTQANSSSSNGINQTVTLPMNLANQQMNSKQHQQQQASCHQLTNDLIGTRMIQGVRSQQQSKYDLTDPASTILAFTTTKASTTNLNRNPSALSSSAGPTKEKESTGFSAIIDLPRMLLNSTNHGASSSLSSQSSSKRSFIKPTDMGGQHHRRSVDSKMTTFHRCNSSIKNYSRNSKAFKFVNTMMMKSASFKRALFPQFHAADAPVSAGESSEATAEKLAADEGEQKPSLVIALSSASSSSTSALSSSAGTAATESSFSSKSAILTPPSQATLSTPLSASKTHLMLNQTTPTTTTTTITTLTKLNNMSKERVA